MQSPDGQVGLRATGQVVLFDGFLKVYDEGRDEEGDGRRAERGRLDNQEALRPVPEPLERDEEQQDRLPVVAGVGDVSEGVFEPAAVGCVPNDLVDDSEVPTVGVVGAME